jgi:hypothetical protein
LRLGAVIGAAAALGRGGQSAVKMAMKRLLRRREGGAPLSEQLQDLYAEAQAEYADRMLERDDWQPFRREGWEQGG